MGKPSGIKCLRRLVNIRKDNRWAEQKYRHRMLGRSWKHSPFQGAPFVRGVVYQKIGIEAKQPNSAIRKCIRAQLIKNGRKITAFVPMDGSLNFIDDNDEVTISGGQRAIGDMPGVKYRVCKVSKVSLLALWTRKKEKSRS